MSSDEKVGYIEAYDAASKLPYYVHSVTKEAVWELPEGAEVIGKATPAPPAAEEAAAAAAAAAASGAAGAGAGGDAGGDADRASVGFKEGWLHKSDPSGKNWKKRWVVVNAELQEMRYYGNNPRHTMALYRVTEEAKGTISLADAAVTKAADTVSKSAPSPHCLELKTSSRTSYFTTKDAAGLESWMTALRVAAKGGVVTDTSAIKAMRPRMHVTAALKEGELLKTAPDGRTWTQRWAKLDPATKTLVYYEDKTKAKAKGLVDLRGATLTVGIEEATLREMPAFVIHSTGRKFGFVTADKLQLQEWLDLVQAAIDFKAMYRVAAGGTKEGQLQKSDPKGRNWKTRFFRLDLAGKMLRYYTDVSATSEKGGIALSGARIHIGTKEVSSPTPFTLIIQPAEEAGRTYYMCATNEEDLIEWFDTLCAVPSVVANVGAAVVTSDSK